MPGTVKIVSQRVKDDILHYPTVELVKKLYPSIQMKGRSIMSSPFRNDSNPSFSCFRDRVGISRWKDHGTGESGDNIDLYRKAFPGLDYVSVMDGLSYLMFGKSALVDFEPSTFHDRPVILSPVKVVKRPVEDEPALVVSRTGQLLSSETPSGILDYCTRRGIPSDVASMYCEYVQYVNKNAEGRLVIDGDSGVPIMGNDGVPLRDDGRSSAIGMRNDIGGYSLRSPDVDGRKGFKGCTSSFPTTILAGGRFPEKTVSLVGNPEGVITFFSYDPSRQYLQAGSDFGFTGIQPYAVRYVVPFLDGWMGRSMAGRDGRGILSVLNTLNGPVNTVVTVVEGMFDALSHIELNRLYGSGPFPEGDLVVLNSTSNLSWAYPFLSMHSEVRSFLDNDMKSSAGEKAFEKMRQDLAAFSHRTGTPVSVRSCSGVFRPYKDLNEYLVKSVKAMLAVQTAQMKQPSLQNDKNTNHIGY